MEIAQPTIRIWQPSPVSFGLAFKGVYGVCFFRYPPILRTVKVTKFKRFS